MRLSLLPREPYSPDRALVFGNPKCFDEIKSGPFNRRSGEEGARNSFLLKEL
jgi:hypothetical protein